MTKDEVPPPEDGLPLRATANDLESGNSAGAKMDAFAGMTNGDATRIRQEARDNAAAGAEKELADLKNMAGGIIYTTRTSIEAYGKAIGIDSVTVGALLDACDDLNEACAANDRERIVGLLRELERLSHDLVSRFRD